MDFIVRKEEPMRKASLMCALVILALSAAGSLMADENLYVSGTVVSSSTNLLVIRTETGNEMTFALDSESSFPANLAVGSRVDVRYHALSGGAYHAAEVRPVGTTAEPVHKPLPRTASPLMLVGLLGLGSMSAAAGLRAFRR
jgi:hypothetical protein